MTTMRKLNAQDYDELLFVLNRAFGNVYQREMDFTRELPRMWVRDDEYMGKHIGMFEDGKLCSVVGVYPLPVRIAGETLNFATTGNVATLPEYEGKGYFTKLFRAAMEEVNQVGYDAARLTGLRHRYARYGYHPCGGLYRFTFLRTNRINFFGNSYENITFAQLRESDTALLAFCRELSNSKPFHVERYPNDGERDVYRAMCGKNSDTFIATRDGAPMGYISASNNGKNITEIRAHNAEEFMDMVCAWQAFTGKAISVPVAPYMPAEFAALAACSQDFSLTSPSRFRIIHWDKVCNALMNLSFATRKLPCGELVLRIEDYGNLRFFVTEQEAGCERADHLPHTLSIPGDKAPSILLGPYQPALFLPDHPELDRWFPLPLSWDVLDYV